MEIIREAQVMSKEDVYGLLKNDQVITNNKPKHVTITNDSVITAEHFIRMVGIGDLLGCSLIGPAGMGKTHLVKNTLDELGVKYITFGGHITLAGMYEFLYEHQDCLIFFDDVSQVIEKTEIMEMLKQALQTNGPRMLNYRSSRALKPHVPNRFEFYGRMIFAFNKAVINPNVRAIFDRAPLLELKYTHKQIIQAFYQIAEEPVNELSVSERVKIVQAIDSYVTPELMVSLRKLFLAFKIYSSFKKLYGDTNDMWVNEVKKLFGKKKVHWMVELLINHGNSMRRVDFARIISLNRDMSLRNAQRRINELLELELLFCSKERNGLISSKAF